MLCPLLKNVLLHNKILNVLAAITTDEESATQDAMVDCDQKVNDALDRNIMCTWYECHQSDLV